MIVDIAQYSCFETRHIVSIIGLQLTGLDRCWTGLSVIHLCPWDYQILIYFKYYKNLHNKLHLAPITAYTFIAKQENIAVDDE